MIKNFNEKNNVNVVGADALICPKKQKHTDNLIANGGITLIALVVTMVVR